MVEFMLHAAREQILRSDLETLSFPVIRHYSHPPVAPDYLAVVRHAQTALVSCDGTALSRYNLGIDELERGVAFGGYVHNYSALQYSNLRGRETYSIGRVHCFTQVIEKLRQSFVKLDDCLGLLAQTRIGISENSQQRHGLTIARAGGP